MNLKEESLEIFWNINFLWIELIVQNRNWNENPFLDKIFLNTKNVIEKSNFS